MATSRMLSVPRFLAKLANLIGDVRPDWDGPGIAAALDQADRDRHAPFVIAAAAFDAAGDPTTRTPAGITARLRDGWGRSTHGWSRDEIEKNRAPLPHGSDYPRCSRCRNELIGGETRETHQCPDQVKRTPEVRAAAIAAMRARAAEELAKLPPPPPDDVRHWA